MNSPRAVCVRRRPQFVVNAEANIDPGPAFDINFREFDLTRIGVC